MKDNSIIYTTTVMLKKKNRICTLSVQNFALLADYYRPTLDFVFFHCVDDDLVK